MTVALILAFILLFMRFTAFTTTVPLIGAQHVPPHVQIGLAAFLAAVSLAANPTIATSLVAHGVGAHGLDFQFLGLVIAELAIGLLLSLVVTAWFTTMQLAGFLQGFQMGFTIANVVDPISQQQASIFGQLHFFIALLVFLAVDGHLLILRGMVESVRLIPPGELALTGPTVEVMVRLMQGIFWGGLQFALPVIGTILVIDLGLGVIARTVPQMNVFMVGLPLKAAVGLLILMLSFGATSSIYGFFLRQGIDQWMRLMPLLRVH
ncbi:MAG: flagellar biosynthetic protein FliR [bacterium]